MDRSRELYLDWNASAPLHPAARDAMRAALDEGLANPSSAHGPGDRSRRRLDDARAAVASLLDAHAEEIVFTSGGTESNHLAIGGALLPAPAGAHAIVAAIEHSSTLAAAQRLEALGARIDRPKPRADGVIEVAACLDRITAATRLVALMAANNETGALQPVAELGAKLAGHKVAYHVDAVQLLGKERWRAGDFGETTLSLSAHKIGGPAGVGALWIAPGTRIEPWIGGGRQERGRRGGTPALLAIIGFAAAALAARTRLLERPARGIARDAFEAALAGSWPAHVVLAAGAPRLPNTSLIALPGHDGARVAATLARAGACVATGSACQAGAPEPSHVLRAMNVPAAIARAAVRFSFGPEDDATIGKRAAKMLVAALRGLAANELATG
ncbi:MAG: aminotransferase class V-fold PLP-dependent enzyme [Planctomycetes bacterium]|nr:aminotransferase class V-fold PLP-dependent enzyme [Planctomycetota bacterium]